MDTGKVIIAKETLIWIIIGLVLLPVILSLALAVVQIGVRLVCMVLYWGIGFPVFLVTEWLKERKSR